MDKYDKIILAPKEYPINVTSINEYCRQHPNQKILLKVDNTYNLTSQLVRKLDSRIQIRIAGGYDDDRLERYKDVIFEGKGPAVDEYFDSVIYSKEETVKILEEIEEIEKGISPNWTNQQKIVYLYDYLKRHITYDPKYKSRPSKDTHSLRGLITKETICAGYALMFKELLERQNIVCHYVRGNGHAWNIVEDEGKLYAIDLTWENNKFRSGESQTFDYLGQNIEEFNKSHIPDKREPFKNYQHRLSTFDTILIRKMNSVINRERDFKKTTFGIVDHNGKTLYVISQVGSYDDHGQKYYRYFYQGYDQQGRKQDPMIFYSESNITKYIYCKKFDKPVNPEYEKGLLVLFSKENIEDTRRRGTSYLGRITKEDDQTQIYKNYRDIPKTNEKCKRFCFPTKNYTRSDGTKFIVQNTEKEARSYGEALVYEYDIFEIVEENGDEVVKKNMVFTEKPFLENPSQEIADVYLSRERIDRKANENGGYIGTFTSVGIYDQNKRMNQYFNKNRRMGDQIYVSIPSFEECRDLARKYEIGLDGKLIKERDTGKIVMDEALRKQALFANLWTYAAGVKVLIGEEFWGSTYAYNESAKEIYQTMIEVFLKNIVRTGTIDTLELYHKMDGNGYRHGHEIIARLFQTTFQTNFINDLFHDAVDPDVIPTKDPVTLFSEQHIANVLENKGGNQY